MLICCMSGSLSFQKSICKFISQVINIDKFYHIKYLQKSKLGNYYSFPEIDNEDFVQLNDICGVLKDPKFDSRGHYFFNF